jgi:two-component system, NarL family, invasion response regulator UvrY
VRLLIADDHELIRQGIKRILADTSEPAFVGEAENGQGLLELLKEENWDVVILDINLPGRNGLDLLKELREKYPKLPVLVLSMYPEEQFAVRAIRAGAAGYLSKANAAREIQKAVDEVSRGRRYISSEVAARMAEAMGGPGRRATHESLSDREYQIFLLIASGKTVGEIAKDLHLSVKTVSTHRAHILEKIMLKNNAELMQYALRHQLTS